MLAFLVLVSGSGVSPSDVLLNSEAPLMDGLDIVYGTHSFTHPLTHSLTHSLTYLLTHSLSYVGTNNAFSDILAYVIVIGLVINFFAFVIFTSQQVCAIAEAGQLPQQLAYRHPIHGAVTHSLTHLLTYLLTHSLM